MLLLVNGGVIWEASDRGLSDGPGLWSTITPAHGMLHLNYISVCVRSRHSPLYGWCWNVLLSKEKFWNVPGTLRKCGLEVRLRFTALLLFGLCSVCCCDENWEHWCSDLWRVSWQRSGANVLHKSALAQKASDVLGCSKWFAKKYRMVVQSLFWWRLSVWKESSRPKPMDVK